MSTSNQSGSAQIVYRSGRSVPRAFVWGKGYLVEGIESPNYTELSSVGDDLIKALKDSANSGNGEK